MFDLGVHITIGHIVEGLIGYFLVHAIVWFAKRAYRRSSEETKAIWQHYQSRARGHGHLAHSVIDCSDGSCPMIGR